MVTIRALIATGIIAFASTIVRSNTVPAADICEAKAATDVPSLEDPESIIKRGDRDTGITQYRIDRKTGATSFCSHGGYCYPTHLRIGGNRIEALVLTNCSIRKPSLRDYRDKDYIYQELDVIRSRVAPKRLAVDDVDNRLLRLGLCSACAGNAAYVYVTRPRSTCGLAVGQVLAGNRFVLKKLKDFGYRCQETATSISATNTAKAPSVLAIERERVRQRMSQERARTANPESAFREIVAIENVVADGDSRLFDTPKNDDATKLISAALLAEQARLDANCNGPEHDGNTLLGGAIEVEHITPLKLETTQFARRTSTLKAYLDVTAGGQHFRKNYAYSFVFEDDRWKLDDIEIEGSKEFHSQKGFISWMCKQYPNGSPINE